VLHSVSISAALMTPDAKTLVGAGSDHKIREVEDCAGTGAAVVRDVDLGPGSVVTAMALPYGGKVLFAGLDSGEMLLVLVLWGCGRSAGCAGSCQGCCCWCCCGGVGAYGCGWV
jgi:hypothetical protein